MPEPGGAAPGVEREFDLEPSDNERLASLCGPLDENLRLIESRLDVQIRRRGNTFRAIGARARATESLKSILQAWAPQACVLRGGRVHKLPLLEVEVSLCPCFVPCV